MPRLKNLLAMLLVSVAAVIPLSATISVPHHRSQQQNSRNSGEAMPPSASLHNKKLLLSFASSQAKFDQPQSQQQQPESDDRDLRASLPTPDFLLSPSPLFEAEYPEGCKSTTILVCRMLVLLRALEERNNHIHRIREARMKADPLRLKEDAVEQRDLPPLGFDLGRLGGAPRAGVQRGQSSLNDLIEPGGAVRGGGGNEGEEQQHKDQLAKQKRQHELKVLAKALRLFAKELHSRTLENENDGGGGGDSGGGGERIIPSGPYFYQPNSKSWHKIRF